MVTSAGGSNGAQSGPVARPLHPADVVLHAACLDAEIVTQRALGPDAGIMAVAEQFTDTAAGEIAGRPDSFGRVHEDRGMAEEAVGKHRNGDKGRVRQLEAAQVIGDPKLGDLKLPVPDHALHDLADVVRAPQLQVDPFGPDPAIEQRARAVVIPAGKGELQIGH